MFAQQFGSFVCVGDTITCEVDGFTATATIYRDDCGDEPDKRDDGFWPSKNPSDAGFVLAGGFDAAQALAERVMAAWKNDEWFYCGVAVTIERKGVSLTGRYDHSLWGVDCNYPGSDNSYLRDVANEELAEALEAAKAKLAELCS